MDPVGSQAYAKTLELTQLLHLAGVMEGGARAEICGALLARVRLPDEWEEPPPLWKSGAKEEEMLRRYTNG